MAKHLRSWRALFFAGAVSPVVLVAATQMQSLDSRDTFRRAALSSAEVKAIVQQVEDSAYDVADDWQRELYVRRVNLGASPGLILEGTNLLCGATGNCQIWVFRKADDNHWVLMFRKDDVPIAEAFRLGPGVSGGIKDFTIQANSSAEAARTVTYTFDGKFYRAK